MHKLAAHALVLTVVLSSCGDGPGPEEDGGAGIDGGGARCASDEACDDGTFCNGDERCAPESAAADARGCVVAGAPACAAALQCDEARDVCESACEIEADADGDGVLAAACGGDDCDDEDAARLPGNPETCDAEDRDEDCDPATFGAVDADGDGAFDAACCNGTVCGDDCDDTRASVNPSASESCNARDEDCDGTIDEMPDQTFYRDLDGDGYGIATDTVYACSAPVGYAVLTGDCDDTRSAVNPGNPEACNLRDDNCVDGVDEGCACAPEGRSEACGPAAEVGVCRFGSRSCIAGMWSACAGGIGSSPEICDGTLDEDCDAMVDEGCTCTNGTTRECGTSDGVCSSVLQSCSMGDWPRACADEPGVVLPSTETCDGSLDEDCDNLTDEGCACTNGATDRTACGTDVGACESGMRTCAAGAWGPCSGGIGPRAELCDGLTDDDCNEIVDNGCTCTDGATMTSGCGTDEGACSVGTRTCTAGAWGLCVGGVPPLTTEACDGVDRDCDARADNIDASTNGMACGTTAGVCTTGTLSCPGSTPVCSGIAMVAETCDHTDQDCDTRIDENLGPATCTRSWTGGTLFTALGCDGTCPAVSGGRGLAAGDTNPSTAYLLSSGGLPDWGSQMSVTGVFSARRHTTTGFGVGPFGVFIGRRHGAGSEATEGLPPVTGVERGFGATFEANPLVMRLELREMTGTGVLLRAQSEPLPSSCFTNNDTDRSFTIRLSNVGGTITAFLDATSCGGGTRTVTYVDTDWNTQLYGESDTLPYSYPRYEIGAAAHGYSNLRVALTSLSVTRTHTTGARPNCVGCPW